MSKPQAASEIRRNAIEEAARKIRMFQDIIGWQPGESRNALIGEIEEAVRELANKDAT